MSESSIHRWHEGELHPLDYCDMADTTIVAADSWLVKGGSALALDLHRRRFFDGADGLIEDLAAFWTASITAIPHAGDWFPRVEVQLRQGAALAVFRLRSAPELSRSVRLASHHGADPRTVPLTKGPDTAGLLRARTQAQAAGADEAVILSPEGFVVEGAYSAILWWRGDVLCVPSTKLDRVDSVTARSVIALATALGIEVCYESVADAELDGCEIWALSALQGIRIVTEWVDGPAPAELPGRLATWRSRLDRLRRPLPT
jgi:branched-subunit amino acid aminotransferase/4-amino-4-deoxychorismate lyase